MVSSSICWALWSKQSGGGGETVCVQPEFSLQLPLEDITRGEGRSIAGTLADDVPLSNSSMESRGSRLLFDDTSLEQIELPGPTLQAMTIMQAALQSKENRVLPLLDKLKEEHDMAKAVKSDDARVPVHLWDKGMVGHEPTDDQKEALSMIRIFCLRVYRRRLWHDAHAQVRRVGVWGRNWQ